MTAVLPGPCAGSLLLFSRSLTILGMGKESDSSVSTITSKYQTTVPKAVRRRLGVGAGDVLHWEAEGGVVRVSAEPPAFFARRGSIPVGKGSVVADVRRARRLRGEAR